MLVSEEKYDRSIEEILNYLTRYAFLKDALVIGRNFNHTCRHPAPAVRPKYREILTKLLDEEHKVLCIPKEDASCNPQGCFLGAPIEEGECMYRDLQERYLPDVADKNNPDYEYVETDNEDL